MFLERLRDLRLNRKGRRGFRRGTQSRRHSVESTRSLSLPVLTPSRRSRSTRSLSLPVLTPSRRSRSTRSLSLPVLTTSRSCSVNGSGRAPLNDPKTEDQRPNKKLSGPKAALPHDISTRQDAPRER